MIKQVLRESKIQSIYYECKQTTELNNVDSLAVLIVVLDKLIRMEMVEKLFRYLSQMNVMNPEDFYDRYIRDDFETQYVPHVFEVMCRQYLIRLNREGLLEEPFEKIGKYYYDDPVRKRNGEFDIVTKDAKGYIFYEAKFRKEPVSAEMIHTEILQVEETGLSCYQYGFFSRAGFSAKQEKNLRLITLEEMYR